MNPVRVVVINLDRRPDRLAAFDRRWQAATGGHPYTRVPGVHHGDPVTGCRLAHLNALTGPGPLLVLEDDAVFAPAFTLTLPPPPAGWVLLRLGGWLAAGVYGRPWTRVERITHTHAYVTADPHRLAAHIRARPGNLSRALSGGIGGHYRLTPATVGQAAGRSDITGAHHTTDNYWE